MYKVMIVDDDPKFVERIQSMIPWEELGYFIVDIELFGVAGLGKFFSYEPDILILASDVYIMRGEEFLYSIKKAAHNYRVIYLSAPDSAPGFPQVCACVDKTTLTGEKLAQLLCTAAQQLEGERQDLSAPLPVQEGQDKQEILESLLQSTSTYRFEHYRTQYGLRLHDTDLVLAMFHPAPCHSVHARHCARIADILDSYANGEHFNLGGTIHCILFNLPQASIIIQNKAHEQLLEQFLQILSDGDGAPIRLYTGNRVHITALREERDALLDLMQYDYFTAASQLIRRMPFNIVHSETLLPQIEAQSEQIRLAVRLRNRKDLDNALEDLFFLVVRRSMNFSVRDLVRGRLQQLYEFLCTCHPVPVIQEQPPQRFDSLEQEHRWHQIRFHALLDTAEAHPGTVHPGVQRVVEYIVSHYREDISLGAAAQEIGLSKSYLCTLFKREMNTGFSDYLNSHRISKAKELLRQQQPVEQVARACGYLDAKYFSRVFKNHTGLSPKRYQLQQTGEGQTSEGRSLQ